MTKTVSRRTVAAMLAGTAALGLRQAAAQEFEPGSTYAAVTNEPFPVPAINLRRLRPEFLRQAVYYDTDAPPGSIVIDPDDHFLYLTDGQGGALRYGVGVGRQGFAWTGTASIHDKREWPDWYPPKEMMARDPHIMASMRKLQSGVGMAGGPGNPLGARAMYLFQGNKDTLYRIHGTVEPYSIGSSISSGCIRMINQDAIDLFSRVPVGTEVRVMASRHRDPNRPVSRYPVPDQPIDGAVAGDGSTTDGYDPRLDGEYNPY